MDRWYGWETEDLPDGEGEAEGVYSIILVYIYDNAGLHNNMYPVLLLKLSSLISVCIRQRGSRYTFDSLGSRQMLRDTKAKLGTKLRADSRADLDPGNWQ